MVANQISSTQTARCLKVDVGFREWMGAMDTPLELWVGFMGREYSVEIPLNTVWAPPALKPDRVFVQHLRISRPILTEVTLTPTQLYYEIQTVGDGADTGWDVMDGCFVLKK